MIWLILAGAVTLALFIAWENRRIERDEGALLDPSMLSNIQLRSPGSCRSSSMFLIQAGFFFSVPLFFSVALGLSAIDTGVRLLPLSLTLLVFRGRYPQAVPECVPSTGRPSRLHVTLRRHGAAGRPA